MRVSVFDCLPCCSPALAARWREAGSVLLHASAEAACGCPLTFMCFSILLKRFLHESVSAPRPSVTKKISLTPPHSHL